MNIISYVYLTVAQVKAIESFQDAVVRTALHKPFVVATFTTPMAQEVKVTLSEAGVIENVAWGDISEKEAK